MNTNDSSASGNNLSRRQWLNRSLPAVAVAGGVFAGLKATASPHEKKDTPPLGAKTYNIQDFGALGDGRTLNTKAVQAAIDACAHDRGGTVLIPAGDFLCGTIQLKSNVTLHLAAQGRLLGSPRREDYTAGEGVPPGNGNIVFIYAAVAENITIEGRGTIDGNGAAFYNGKGDNTGPGQHGVGGNFDRPHLLIFYQCSNLLMQHAFFTASAYHCCRILKCRQVHIDGIRIYNRVNKNNDGFHFNDGQYVHVTNCDIQCQDDACALFGSNQFVTISNCSFSTRWSVFRFGGGRSENITITNCLIYDTYGCPIKISAGRTSIEYLSFSNIIMRNVTGPIGIGFSGTSSNNNNTSSTEKPYVRNIAFNNIRATTVKQPVNHPDIPWDVNGREGEKNSCITLNAMGDYYLENISLTDIEVLYAGGGSAEQAAKRNVPNIAAEYFGVWDAAPGGPPAYGLYARNVKGLTLHHVRFDYKDADARPAVILDHVEDAAITGLSIKGSEHSEAIRLINTKDVLFSATRLLSPAKTFFQLEGAQTEHIYLNEPVAHKAGSLLSFQNGALKKSVTVKA